MICEVYDDYLDFYDDNRCNGDLGEKWCSFSWRICDLELNPTDVLQSPVFTTRLLPKTYWYLNLQLSSPGNLQTIKISLHRLENHDGVVSTVDVIYKFISSEKSNVSDKRRLTYNNKTTGSERYFYTASFHKSEKGYVTIDCKLRPSKSMIQDVCHDADFDDSLSLHFRKLLQSGELSDAIIKVGDQQLKVHLVIIFARLPKLLMMDCDTKNGKRIINIKDLPVSMVKEMLKYAYTGQACLDLDSVWLYKNILDKYSEKFVERCCWEDNPYATSFFNYETDSLSWKLTGISTTSNAGKKKIKLLRLHPSEIELSLDVLEAEQEEKGLTLTLKFCGEEMPKPTMVSCNSFLLNIENQDRFELGESLTLLNSNITEAKVKLCSLLEVKRGKSTLHAMDFDLVLKTEFKFCYGSSKSSIENLYEGHFDISRCTSCALLSADLEKFYEFDGYFNRYTDLKFVSGKYKIFAHKAILLARWNEAEKYKVKEKSCIEIKGYDKYRDLRDYFLKPLYTGTLSKYQW